MVSLSGLMLTAMRNVPVRRLLIALTSGLVIFAAFAAGIGVYAAARAWWPFVLVWWPWLVAGVVAVVALGTWWLWWRLPKLQVDRLRVAMPDPKDRVDVEDNFRKTVGQALGGIFVLLGAGLAYWGTFQTLQANRQASRDLLVSNQVSKGFEQFGSDNIRVRLGGIYALEGVMKTSEQYREPVLEALSAFIRDGTQTVTGDGPPATDIQAALTVIGRIGCCGTADLTNAHIPKADLTFADLSTHTLMGADLRGAMLFMANLNDTNLSGANLTGATLTGAHLENADLSGANLSGAKLVRAKLNGARLFPDANLSGANLTDATLDLTILLGLDLHGADLSGADLHETAISQKELDQACGSGAKLEPGLRLKPCAPSQ
jgi:uncharacterized protein YjbI with pentapeptide repeats